MAITDCWGITSAHPDLSQYRVRGNIATPYAGSEQASKGNEVEGTPPRSKVGYLRCRLEHFFMLETPSMSYAALKGMIFPRSRHQSSDALRDVAINPSLALESH
jgi:hypothetical protein